MKGGILIFLSVLIFHSLNVLGQKAKNWQQISTVEDVCEAFPGHVDYVFQNLDLDYPGLEHVKLAYEGGDMIKAGKLLLKYYYEKDIEYLKIPQQETLQVSEGGADSILQDIYTFQRVAGQVPRSADGHLDWYHNGSEEDIEWAWALNRHYPVSYILPYFYQTRDQKYAMYIDQFIKDWIIESWPYPAEKSRTAMWRGLEVSFRAKVWSKVFYGLGNMKYISPATQLLILGSLPDHAHYARNYHAQNNWLTMEISGLATVATSWPEFERAEEWLNYSIETMTESLRKQVYPDGVQTELTSSYHFVALRNFELFYNICDRAGKELPEFYKNTLEDMYDYLACTIRPNGFGLLNNDADKIKNIEKIRLAAEKFDRQDWNYVITHGQEGVRPDHLPSYFYPWAGHLISRSGFDREAHWSFFDVGPWGSGHQHNDKLHISITAFGRDFLVDGGRFAYRGEVARKFREYARGSLSHNVILVDGKGQKPGPKLAQDPVSQDHYKISEEFDYAVGTFDKFISAEGKVNHTRAFMFIRDVFWVVVDQLTTDRPREIDVLWHWHPECKVESQKRKAVCSTSGHGNLKIMPVGSRKWRIKMVKGQEKPEIQGWYSEVYNRFEPNVATIYSTEIKSTTSFVWLIEPYKDGDHGLKAKILFEGPEEIKLRVKDEKNDIRDITVPFLNSSKAEVKLK